MTQTQRKFVGPKELKPIYGIPYTRQYLDKLSNTGKFPKKVKLAPGQCGRIGWWADEIEAWLETKAAA